MTELGAEGKWKFFCHKFDEVANNNVPRVKKRRKYPVPLEGKIRDKVKEKDIMSRRVNDLKKQNKWREYDEMWKRYCKVRNKVRNMSRSARKDFEMKIADDAKENPKKIFAYMNSKIKSRQGIGDICIDLEDPKSKVTEKENIFSI